MWIKSQSGRDCVNTENATNIFISGPNVHIAFVNERSVCLGSYHDGLRAAEIIGEIMDAEGIMLTCYEMPKE